MTSAPSRDQPAQGNPDPILLRCEIGHVAYALDTAWVRSIESMDRMSPIGQDIGAPAGAGRSPGRLRPMPIGALAGLDAKVPVYSLAEALGRGEGPTQAGPSRLSEESAKRVIVPRLDHRGGQETELPPWALVVDRVGQAFSVPAAQVVPMPSVAIDPRRDAFTGVVLLDTEMLLLLAPGRLIHQAREEEPVLIERADAGSRKRQPPRLRTADRLPKSDEGRPDVSPGSTGRLVRFSLPRRAELSFALSLSEVQAAVDMLPVLPIPFAPNFVRGLVQWRGHAVPLLDLAHRLGLPPAAQSGAVGNARLLIVRSSGGSRLGHLELWGGFVVDGDVHLTPVPAARRTARFPVPMPEEMIWGVFEGPQGCLVIPDLRAVLTQSAGSRLGW